MIIVGPLSKVQPIIDEHGVSHVVTLLAPDTPHPAPRGVQQDRHLKLYFHDIVQAMEGHTPPREADPLLGRHQPLDGCGLHRTLPVPAQGR
jgi:predicted protein tyrosine phosphatase